MRIDSELSWTVDDEKNSRNPSGPSTIEQQYILTLSCPDQRGVVHKVSCFLADHYCNIIDSAQYADVHSKQFFMRILFSAEQSAVDEQVRSRRFSELANALKMAWELRTVEKRLRVVILVSKIGHCLNDLLFRYKTSLLAIDIVAIVSNHADFAQLAENYKIPFFHLPVDKANPSSFFEQEEKIMALVEDRKVDLVVLARYMQIISPRLCSYLQGRLINIHHSFLPSFKGAKPYSQAHDLGVKLIGATAHFVTAELDEGPIIEQDVTRVDHTKGPAELAAIGCDAESVVLARAVKWFSEHRVLLNGRKTVVFQ